ncbi:hypothetical protein BD780_002808 [Clostridium tetanomorphum]|uniref:Uncharacterized protein n=1 Tax=Clostridium tetanomorphum TaxID=1553 RepID=A0A923E926_CLOTT|nr:hypothetical protein [Clostridium tetanomorphum]KAJ53842.1 hypothetical protein CTM_01195 [Clostridium tetanomorphum DSM 665]MBC2397356.1 hypothetical protein [Clostridium tetanomorphum]MBP1862576.1 hypothetical protein [Clostridium tetanomorphum]NRS85583.1 hypothetical protein [Clostridium tetanomorphum]NRZ96406.1 hypothetical protein [Clostridium tetanomorphum]
MVESVFETIIMGSNTIFLDIPEEQYLLKYTSLSLDSAQNLADYYFKYRGRDVMPEVKDIDLNSDIHRVKITVELNEPKRA